MFAVMLGLASATLVPAQTNPPPFWREQVQADWLRQDAKRLTPASTGRVTREEDAAGGVDGRKNGQWGFHTEMQKDPWWQVDLGQTVSLGRVVLYNRCDRSMVSRTRRPLSHMDRV